jgi:hypothetical protein
MGREIRRVPPNWDHPRGIRRNGREDFVPMHDQTWEAAAEEWLADFDRIRRGDLSKWEKYDRGVVDWAAENPAPDPNSEDVLYRPWSDEEATWFQVWQTVSEGSPVTPPFSTPEDLIAYLAAHGDFWDQDRCKKADWAALWGGTPGQSGWGRERAERFVNAGWAPTFIATDGVVTEGKWTP